LSAQTPAPAVGRFAEPGPGSVNAWWIDAPGGLVVVDFQRDTASAAAAIERVKAAGKPLAALLLTHPHPDHIGGLDQFKRAFPDAPLFASRASADEIEADTRGYQRMTRAALGDRAPARHPAPDRIVENGAPLRIADLDVEALELGPGEAAAATVYHLPASGALFAGDVAVSGMADFLLEGRTGAWLAQIERLRAAFLAARTLYPGHGEPGRPAAILDETAGVLRFYRARTLEAIARGEVMGVFCRRRACRRSRTRSGGATASARRSRSCRTRRGEREGGRRRTPRRSRAALTPGPAGPPVS
jgi:glyoxylase-like metal-dependent hydrolase (beta-lactamase superfamily II)